MTIRRSNLLGLGADEVVTAQDTAVASGTTTDGTALPLTVSWGSRVESIIGTQGTTIALVLAAVVILGMLGGGSAGGGDE